MAVSFIAFDNQENAYYSSRFKFPAVIDRDAMRLNQGLGAVFSVAGTFGLDLTRQALTLCSRHCWNSRISLHVLFAARSSSPLFGLFLAVPHVNTKPSTKKNPDRKHLPNL